MRHLFLEEDLLPAWNRASQLRDDLSPIGFALCDDFIGTRMLLAGRS